MDKKEKEERIDDKPIGGTAEKYSVPNSPLPKIDVKTFETNAVEALMGMYGELLKLHAEIEFLKTSTKAMHDANHFRIREIETELEQIKEKL